jgi:hypothetical protein
LASPRLALSYAAAVVVVACSPSAQTAGGDDANAAGDDGGLCLTCVDASYDVPALVRVRGELTAVCANADGCHGAGAGGLGLSAQDVFGPLINVPSSEVPSLVRVKPFDPDLSYLYRKVRCEGGIEGGCMPLGGQLDPTLLRAFHDWIEAGAPTQ